MLRQKSTNVKRVTEQKKTQKKKQPENKSRFNLILKLSTTP